MPTLCAVHVLRNNATRDSHIGFLMISKIMKITIRTRKLKKNPVKEYECGLLSLNTMKVETSELKNKLLDTEVSKESRK